MVRGEVNARVCVAVAVSVCACWKLMRGKRKLDLAKTRSAVSMDGQKMALNFFAKNSWFWIFDNKISSRLKDNLKFSNFFAFLSITEKRRWVSFCQGFTTFLEVGYTTRREGKLVSAQGRYSLLWFAAFVFTFSNQMAAVPSSKVSLFKTASTN